MTDDEDNILYERIVQVFSHGGHSLFEPVEMVEDNKILFEKILTIFMNQYAFNEKLFTETGEQ